MRLGPRELGDGMASLTSPYAVTRVLLDVGAVPQEGGVDLEKPVDGDEPAICQLLARVVAGIVVSAVPGAAVYVAWLKGRRCLPGLDNLGNHHRRVVRGVEITSSRWVGPCYGLAVIGGRDAKGPREEKQRQRQKRHDHSCQCLRTTSNEGKKPEGKKKRAK